MSSLFSFLLFSILPRPNCQGLILRPTHNLISEFIIENSYSMFMVSILRYFLPSCNVPDNSLPIPRSTDKMLRINERKWRNRTVMLDQHDWISRMIQTINFTISTPCQNKNLWSTFTIDLNRLNIFLEYCYCCYLLYALPFGRVYFQCFVSTSCH